ncbi:dimethyladenosine transferase 2, mitochondrial isoform X2 [Gracilinanus agilis]|uniref:dimethyladenosine transferase 2, mitochondrial isoform X2 n=1 Tax=Gracilinanus agilis TaxID=191870 RepID=UPI001CFEF197|nr:dimethyladenosine transferase 2, mitochondrial isoform X2 [Gracilinanus agilis]
MWGSVTSLPSRLSITTVAGICPRLRWEMGLACSARLRRRLTQSCLECQPFPGLHQSETSLRSNKWMRLFPGSTMVADTVAHLLQAGPPGSSPWVLECNPGPGMITSALLNAGLQVIALEKDKTFLPYLESLKTHLSGQLEVIYCDFFNRDPPDNKVKTPPAMFTETLFRNFGIREIPWTADVPVKIVGFFPAKNERNVLWKFLYDLYSRSSIYDYGRIELNMFISEQEYKKIISKPGEKFYQPLSVLCQTAYEIKLLHKESKNNHLNFIQLTPRRNLFTDNLTPMNSCNFMYLVKQCFAKRRYKLIDLFNSWYVHEKVDLLQKLSKNKHDLVASLGPEEFKYLFEVLESSETFTQKWLFDHFLQNTVLEST